MANKRILDLTTESSVANGDFIEVDRSGWAESRKASIEEITETERTARQSQDNVIEAGAGLNANGTYTAPAASNYMTAALFAAAGLSENLYNGVLLLDEQIKANADNIDNTLRTAEVELSVAEFNTLFTVPVTLVDIGSWSASVLLDVIDAVAWIDWGSVAWDVGSQELEVYYDTGNTILTFTNGLIEAVADTYQKAIPTDQTNILKGKSIKVKLPSANPLVVGDSKITISISYRAITI